MEAATAPPLDPEHDAPPLDPPGPPALDPVDIEVPGTAQLELFDLGGKKPTSSKLRLAGGAVAVIDGQAFRKGDVVRFSGTAVVSAVTQQDKRDSATQQVVSCEQKHTATITDLTIDSE